MVFEFAATCGVMIMKLSFLMHLCYFGRSAHWQRSGEPSLVTCGGRGLTACETTSLVEVPVALFQRTTTTVTKYVGGSVVKKTVVEVFPEGGPNLPPVPGDEQRG